MADVWESGNPAAGWVSRLWRTGETLLADLVDLPPQVQAWIANGNYRFVSAEIDRYPPGERHPQFGVEGAVLRAVALLGADPPAVKGLKPIPRPLMGKATGVEIFSAGTFHKGTPDQVTFTMGDLDTMVKNFTALASGDRPRCTPYVKIGQNDPHEGPMMTFAGRIVSRAVKRMAARSKTNRNKIFSFAEVTPMDRQQMLDALAQAGVDVSKITDVVPDEVLAEMLRVMQEMQAQAGAGAADQGANASGNTGQGAGGTGGGNGMLIPKSLTAKFNEAMGTITTLTSELNALKGTATATANLIQASHDTARKDAVHAFCEQQVTEGRLTPAEVECDATGNPLPHTVKARLLRADHTKRHVFSEGGKQVQRTEMELQMDEIRKRPAVKLSEKIAAKGGAGGNGGNLWAKVRERAKQDQAARSSSDNSSGTLHKRLGLLPPAHTR